MIDEDSNSEPLLPPRSFGARKSAAYEPEPQLEPLIPQRSFGARKSAAYEPEPQLEPLIPQRSFGARKSAAYEPEPQLEPLIPQRSFGARKSAAFEPEPQLEPLMPPRSFGARKSAAHLLNQPQIQSPIPPPPQVGNIQPLVQGVPYPVVQGSVLNEPTCDECVDILAGSNVMTESELAQSSVPVCRNFFKQCSSNDIQMLRRRVEILRSLPADSTDYKEELKKAKTQFDTLERANREKIRTSETNLQRLRNNYADVVSQLRQLTGQRGNLMEQLATIRAELTAEKKRCKERLDKCFADLSGRNNDNRALTAEVKRLKDELKRATQTDDAQKVAELKEQLDSLKQITLDNNTAFENEYNKISQLLRAKEAELAALRQTAMTTQEAVASARDDVNAKLKEMTDLLAKKNEEALGYIRRILSQDTEIEELKSKCAGAGDQSQALRFLEERLNEKDQTIAQIKERVKNDTSENQRLFSDILKDKDELNKLNQDIDVKLKSAEKELSEKEANIETMNAQLEDAMYRVQRITEENKNLNSKLSSLSTNPEIKDLTNQITQTDYNINKVDDIMNNYYNMTKVLNDIKNKKLLNKKDERELARIDVNLREIELNKRLNTQFYKTELENEASATFNREACDALYASKSLSNKDDVDGLLETFNNIKLAEDPGKAKEYAPLRFCAEKFPIQSASYDSTNETVFYDAMEDVQPPGGDSETEAVGYFAQPPEGESETEFDESFAQTTKGDPETENVGYFAQPPEGESETEFDESSAQSTEGDSNTEVDESFVQSTEGDSNTEVDESFVQSIKGESESEANVTLDTPQINRQVINPSKITSPFELANAVDLMRDNHRAKMNELRTKYENSVLLNKELSRRRKHINGDDEDKNDGSTRNNTTRRRRRATATYF